MVLSLIIVLWRWLLLLLHRWAIVEVALSRLHLHLLWLLHHWLTVLLRSAVIILCLLLRPAIVVLRLLLGIIGVILLLDLTSDWNI